jgi:hypothetical protein
MQTYNKEVNKLADPITGTIVFHSSGIYRFKKWHIEHGNCTLSVSFNTCVNMVLKEVHLSKFHVTQRTRVAFGWRNILIIYLQDTVYHKYVSITWNNTIPMSDPNQHKHHKMKQSLLCLRQEDTVTHKSFSSIICYESSTTNKGICSLRGLYCQQ